MRSGDWDARWSDPARPPSPEPNRFLAAEAEGLEPGRALDLACGAGRNAVWLAERGWRVAAVDFSPVALAAARRLAAARGVAVDWTEADVLGWTPPGAYDLVAILYLQLPEAERRPVLAGAAAAVAPGGTLLFVAHDLANLEGGHGGPRNPAVLTTPEAVAGELPGLEVERAERVGRPVPLEGGAEATAVDTLVRASRPRPALSR